MLAPLSLSLSLRDLPYLETENLTYTRLSGHLLEKLDARYAAIQGSAFDAVKFNTTIKLLEYIAYQSMLSGEVKISYARIRKCLVDHNIPMAEQRDYIHRLLALSLLRPHAPIADPEHNDYYFIHLAFQEHLAARHWISRWLHASTTNAAEAEFQAHKFNIGFDRVWRFVAGLLSMRPGDAAKQTNQYFDLWIAEPRMILGDYESFIIMQCWDEVFNLKGFKHQKALEQWLVESLYDKFPNKMREAYSVAFKKIIYSSVNLWRLVAVACFAFVKYYRKDLKKTAAIDSTFMDLITLKASFAEFGAFFVDELRDSNADVRSRAAEALGNQGKATPGVIEVLVRALGDSDANVRSRVAEALVKLSKDTPEVIEVLLGALGDSETHIRSYVAEVLVKLGKDMPEVIEVLVGALDNADADVRSRAAEALVALGKAMPSVITVLVGVLGNSDADVRSRAVEALVKLGKATPQVMEVLVGALGDPYWRVRSGAAEALGKIGTATPSMIEILVSALENDPYWRVRSIAAEALGKLGRDTPSVIGVLVRALADAEGYVRSKASEALVRLGKDMPGVIEALMGTLGNADADVRSRTAEALGNLGKDTPSVIEMLLRALGDSDSYWRVRSRAAEALGKIGKDKPSVIEALVRALGDSESYVRSSSAEALGNLGKATPGVIEVLARALSDSDADVRFSTAEALANLGKVTPGVIEVLVRTLGDADWFVRSHAAGVLGRMADSMTMNKGLLGFTKSKEILRDKIKIYRLLVSLYHVNVSPYAYSYKEQCEQIYKSLGTWEWMTSGSTLPSLSGRPDNSEAMTKVMTELERSLALTKFINTQAQSPLFELYQALHSAAEQVPLAVSLPVAFPPEMIAVPQQEHVDLEHPQPSQHMVAAVFTLACTEGDVGTAVAQPEI